MKRNQLLNKKIEKYYDSCEIDYRMLWNLDKSYALHYGYWDKKVRNFPQALERENEVLADRAKIKKEDVVLDAGCGVGGSSIFLAKKFNCRVTGISLSRKQIEKAQANAHKNGVAHLTDFRLMDYTKTNFKAFSFDVVWAIESVCHSHSKEKFIKEAYRILKKNGRLILADFFATKKSYSIQERNIMKKWLDGWSMEFLKTDNSFRLFLENIGFKQIQFLDITDKVIPSSKRLYLFSFPGFFLGKIAEVLKIRTKIQTSNIIAAYYQYKTLTRGLWKYGIFSAQL